MKKKLIITFFITLLLPFNIYAKTLSDLRKELTTLEASLKKAQEQERMTEEEMNKLNAEITKVVNQIKDTELEIERANKKIEINEQEIAKKEIETGNLLKYFQVSSSENVYLKYLFESKTYTEFIYRYAVINQLTEYNDNLMKELTRLISELEQSKIELADKQIQLENEKKDYSNKLMTLRANFQNLKEEGTTIEEDIRDLKKEIASYEELGCDENMDVRICRSAPNAFGWTYPLLSGGVTSNYTSNREPVYDSSGRMVSSGAHYGIDLSNGREGSPVYAAAPGVVTRIIERSSCGGNMIFLYHTINGVNYTTVYMHLLTINVKFGNTVDEKTIIGTMGGGRTSTYAGGYDGCTNGAHLHFGMARGWNAYSFNANSFNPRLMLEFPNNRFSR